MAQKSRGVAFRDKYDSTAQQAYVKQLKCFYKT